MLTFCNGTLAFSYARYRTYEGALEALDDCYATGEVSECEVLDIRRIGDRWHILLRAA